MRVMHVHRMGLKLFGLPVERYGLVEAFRRQFSGRPVAGHYQPIDYTRVDLAIKASNREFLAHDHVQRFLDRVWETKSEARGMFGFKPRTKFLIHFLIFTWLLLLL